MHNQDGGWLEFNQNADLGGFEWEQVLFQFIRRYTLNFIKLELLMFFYRNALALVSAESIVGRTGYHMQEIAGNLSKLAEDGLLHAEASPQDIPGLFRKLDETEFAGRRLVLQVIRRMVEEFKEREGRLRIIYSLLKAREDE